MNLSEQQADEILKLLRHLTQDVAQQRELLEATVNLMVEMGNVTPLDLDTMQAETLEKLRPFFAFVQGASVKTLLGIYETPQASPKSQQPGLRIVPKTEGPDQGK